MKNTVSPETLKNWITAWAVSRNLSLPTKFKSGYKVAVGYEKQKERYLFAEPNDDYVQLSNTIEEPWVFLKVCASPEEVKKKISAKWVIQPPGYMMSCDSPMSIPDIHLPEGYELSYDSDDETALFRIFTKSGELASSGRVIIVNDLAVYDRIITEDDHKRKGLATLLLRELEQIALSRNVSKNFLVATEQGRLLYQSLGWQVCSPYTSAVITS